jgi:hypothetical protein
VSEGEGNRRGEREGMKEERGKGRRRRVKGKKGGGGEGTDHTSVCPSSYLLALPSLPSHPSSSPIFSTSLLASPSPDSLRFFGI